MISALALVVSGVASNVAPAQDVLVAEDMVVTSTRIGESRRGHSGNIAKIPEDEVDFVNPSSQSELLNRAPAVNIQQGSGVESLTAIRSPVLNGGAGAGSFLYLEDGVSLRAAGFANVNGLFESVYEFAGGIEVVRGPGSALYGSNAIHGLINVLSRAPSLDQETILQGTYGPNQQRFHQGTQSQTLESGEAAHGYRVNFRHAHDGGYRDNSNYSQYKSLVRYDYEGGRDFLRATVAVHHLDQNTAGFVVGENAYKDSDLRFTNPTPNAFRDSKAVRASVRYERPLENGPLLTFTPYARWNDMDFRLHFFPGTPIEKNDHWSVGLQSTAYFDIEGGHSVIVGLDTEYTVGDLKETQSSPTIGSFTQGTHYDYEVDALVVGPYIHSVWQLFPRTRLVAGFRFEYTRYDYTNKAETGVVGRFFRPPNSTDSYRDPAPKVGLVHDFDDNLTGFVRYARGTRAPQTTDNYRLQRFQDPGEVNSEQIDSIEVGTRGFYGDTRFELVGYYMEKQNFFFRDANGLNVSDGKTDHLGVELDFFSPLMFGFDIGGYATYAEHTYAFNRRAGGASTQINKGDYVDTAPRTLANMRLGYTLPERLRAEIEWVHVGEYYQDAGNTRQYTGHDVFNFRSEVTVDDWITGTLKVTNLNNKRYANRADFAFGNSRYFPADERAIYIGARMQF